MQGNFFFVPYLCPVSELFRQFHRPHGLVSWETLYKHVCFPNPVHSIELTTGGIQFLLKKLCLSKTFKGHFWVCLTFSTMSFKNICRGVKISDRILLVEEVDGGSIQTPSPISHFVMLS